LAQTYPRATKRITMKMIISISAKELELVQHDRPGIKKDRFNVRRG